MFYGDLSMSKTEWWKNWEQQVADYLEKHGFRLVVKEDLVDHKEIVMIEISPGDTLWSFDSPDKWGTHIRLDKHPEGNGKVYYYVGSGGGSRCFVPVELFLGGIDAMIAPKTILFIVRK